MKCDPSRDFTNAKYFMQRSDLLFSEGRKKVKINISENPFEKIELLTEKAKSSL